MLNGAHLSTVCPFAKCMSASVFVFFFFFDHLAGPISGLLTPFNDAQTVMGSMILLNGAHFEI